VQPLDVVFLLNNNLIRFTQSARRHRIGRARVRHVLRHTTAVTVDDGPPPRLLLVGENHTGRKLEIVAVWEFPRLFVIHVMDARPVIVRRYEEGMRDGQES
jgi:hypothetical protein